MVCRWIRFGRDSPVVLPGVVVIMHQLCQIPLSSMKGLGCFAGPETVSGVGIGSSLVALGTWRLYRNVLAHSCV